MYTSEEILGKLNCEITGLDKPKEPKLLYEPINYLLSAGGKRIRPLLVLMAHNLFCDEIEESMSAAMAIELFHNFTLLHDDIMDNSDTRRGRATVNVKWNNNVAILSGDTMTIMAYQYLSRSPQRCLKEVFDIFNRLAIEICEGQRYDMDFESTDEVSIDQYIEMIRLKTSVLLAGALKIGAVIGNATPQNAEILYCFGIKLGLAFQLSDDMLDTYGNPDEFGKKIGGDIIEGKKTYLLLTTLNNASQQDRRELKRIIADKTMPREEKIAAVKTFYTRYQAKKNIEDKIEAYYLEAVSLLRTLPVAEERKQVLYKLTDEIIKRNK